MAYPVLNLGSLLPLIAGWNSNCASHFAGPGDRIDAGVSRNLQLASNFASRGGRSPSSCECIGDGGGDTGVRRRSPLDVRVGTRHPEPIHEAKSADSEERCTPAMLDTPGRCDMLARLKRNGISRGCEPPSTSSDAPMRGLRPLRFELVRDTSGEAGALPMGDRKAAIRCASTPTTSLARTPLPLEYRLCALPLTPTYRSDDTSLPLPGTCGMRIAAHFHQVPVEGSDRQAVQEVA